jgi:LEA14-like dessication related protein
VTTQRIALGLLLVLAVVFGINLISSAGQFSTAYEVYDRLGLELEEFRYVNPDEPVTSVLRVTNPPNKEIEIIAIELRLNAGLRRVGGGETRPEQVLAPNESQSFAVRMAIDDRTYVRDIGLPDEQIDWRVSGRIQVRLAESLDPVWIPFVVRYLE